MDRQSAVSTIYDLINSYILKEELEERLIRIGVAIEYDKWLGEKNVKMMELEVKTERQSCLIAELEDMVETQSIQLSQKYKEIEYLKSEISSKEREKEKMKQAYYLQKEVY